MNTKIFLFLLLLLAVFSEGNAQREVGKSYFNIQLNGGFVTNSPASNRMAYGIAAGALIPVNNKDFFTAGIKAISNPFDNEPFSFLKNGFNRKGDALNYVILLTGIRFNLNSFDKGYFYAEPRAGVAFAHGFARAGIGISPSVGYKLRSLDLNIFADGGFMDKKLNTKKKNFLTIGAGIGFTF